MALESVALESVALECGLGAYNQGSYMQDFVECDCAIPVTMQYIRAVYIEEEIWCLVLTVNYPSYIV